MIHAVNSNNFNQATWPAYISVPVLFFKTLFEPFYFSSDELKSNVKKLKEDGMTAIVNSIGRTILNHPVDTALTAGALILNFPVIQSNSLQLIMDSTSLIKMGHMLIKKASTIDSKAFKMGLYGTTFLLIVTSPVAVAAFHCTTADSRMFEIAQNVASCLNEGHPLETCRDLIPIEMQSRYIVTTHHSSGAFSIAGWKNENFCIDTLLTRVDKNATEICFPGMVYPNHEIASRIESAIVHPIPKMHFNPSTPALGTTKISLSFRLKENTCQVEFFERANTNLPDDSKCISTIVNHICIDPRHPATTIQLFRTHPEDYAILNLNFLKSQDL